MGPDDSDRLRFLLESQHDFPGPFTFKVIFRSAPGVGEGILAAIAEETTLRELHGEPSLRASSGGKYVAMTFDLVVAEAAIADRDLAALGAVTEASALAMHAAAIASRPTILYWQPATLAAMAAVRELRAAGRSAWATMDAGPHVKVLTSATDADAVATALRGVPGVTAVAIAAAGPGTELVA